MTFTCRVFSPCVYIKAIPFKIPKSHKYYSCDCEKKLSTMPPISVTSLLAPKCQQISRVDRRPHWSLIPTPDFDRFPTEHTNWAWKCLGNRDAGGPRMPIFGVCVGTGKVPANTQRQDAPPNIKDISCSTSFSNNSIAIHRLHISPENLVEECNCTPIRH